MALPSDNDHSGGFWFGMGALRAFERDERGTAMTEFIITLPVFIIIWVGMLNLYKLERQSVRVKILAVENTWDNAMDVADGGLFQFDPDTMITQLAAGQAMSNISSKPSGNADWMAQFNNLGLLMDGTAGQADNSTQALSLIGQSPSGNAPGSNLSAYPRDMLDDSRFNAITSAPGALAAYFMVIPLSFLGPNQVPAAGMRYGDSVGEAEVEFEVLGRQRTYEATYDVLNTPVDKPQFLEDMFVVPGFSRLMAEEDPCLSNILELSTDMGYMSNCM